LKRTLSNTTIADRLLFFLLLTVSLAGLFFTKEALSQGSEIRIEVKGRPLYSLPLDKDKQLIVDVPHGSLLVEIKDRRVRVKEAPCPNQVCVRQGWISGGSIVCLPNGVVIFVGSPESGPGKALDAITG
jgi:hypothetical protein